MAALGNRVAEVYIQLKVKEEEAIRQIKSVTDAQLDNMKKLINANEKYLDLKDKMEEGVSKRTLKRIAKEVGADAEATREGVENQKKALKSTTARYEAQEKASKKHARRIMEHNAEINKQWNKILDYMGSSEANRLAKSEKGNERHFQRYSGFLERAATENNRFADRLGRRDMTSSLFENLQRGMQKGMLISNKFHRDDNTLQRFARSIGIAGSAFIKVRSYSEQATNQFYRFQRVGYTLQTIFGVLAGSIGSLVGGLMALIGVIGQAAVSAVAAGSAFLSLGAGAIAARMAMGGISNAVKQATIAQGGYNNALSDARKELRALKFDAEAAALSEMDAALSLEKAREELARVQDLPPDSRVRREIELQYMQAELSYRQAKARNKELAKQVEEGAPGLASRNAPAGGSAADQAMQQLTASQQKFVRYLISIQPKLKELKEASASAFLAPLKDAIAILLTGLFPTLKSGLGILGAAYGEAAKDIAKAMVAPDNIILLDSFFRASAPIIRSAGKAISYAFGGLLAILKAAEPLTTRFTEWVEGSAKSFELWAKAGLNNGSLEAFYNLSGDVAARLGLVFRNVFDSINNIIKATFPSGPNSGAGGVLLTWLETITNSFKAFTSSNTFSTWLEGATTNATIALSSIGKLLSVMTDIAAMPEIGEFWSILSQSEGNIRKMLSDGVKAGPAFAKLLNSLIQLIAAFSDATALQLFFDVLNAIVKPLADLFTNMKPVIDALGQFHAIVLAVSLATISFNLAGRIFFGVLEKGANSVGLLAAGMVKLGYAQKTLVPGIQMVRANYKTLSVDAVGLAAKLKLAKSEFATTFLTLGTAKRSAYLLQIVKDAGLAKVEVEKLRAGLQAAQRQGMVTTNALATYGGNAAILAKAGYQTSEATAGARMSSFGRGAATVAGVGGSMIGMAQPGASGLTQGLGTASMIASLGAMIPGPVGIASMVASAVLGIGSAITGLFDAQAAKEKEKEVQKANEEKIIKAAKIEALNIETAKFVDKSNEARSEINSFMLAGGLNKRQAVAAVAREQGQAVSLGATKGVSATTVDTIRQSLISAGGDKIAEAFAKDTKTSNELLANAINSYNDTRGNEAGTKEQMAGAAQAIIDAYNAGGLKKAKEVGAPSEIDFTKNKGTGQATPSFVSPALVKSREADAVTRTRMQATLEYNEERAYQKTAIFAPAKANLDAAAAAVKKIDDYLASVEKNPSTGNIFEVWWAEWEKSKAMTTLEEAQTTFDKVTTVLGPGYKPEVTISPANNSVTIGNKVGVTSPEILTALNNINANTKNPPPSPAIYLTIDEKTLRSTGWQKVGG